MPAILLTLLSTLAFSKSDPKAVQLLHQVETRAKHLSGYSLDLTSKRIYTSSKEGAPPNESAEKIHVEFKRPNLFIIESEERGIVYKTISDGKHLYSTAKDSYTVGTIDPKAAEYHWYHDDILELLVTGSFAQAIEAPYPPVLHMLPDEKMDGIPYQVISANIDGGYPIAYHLYIGRDGYIHRILHVDANNGRPLTIDSEISRFSTSTPLSASAFSFKPTAEMKLRGDFALRPGEFPPIEVGAAATDFSLPTPYGGTISLSKAKEGKRAVLLNFWFVHCPPCRAEHPKLQKFYNQLAPKGLGLITIDDQDPAALSASYLKGAGLTFPVVLTGPRFRTDPVTGKTDYMGPSMPDYASLFPYGVRECPTNILIDAATGKVVYRSLEWDEAGLRKALESLGVK